MPSVIPTRPDGIGTERKVPVFRCRRQAVCASSFSKMAGSALYVRSPRVVFAAMTASHSSVVRSEASIPESAVPHAGNSWASAGRSFAFRPDAGTPQTPYATTGGMPTARRKKYRSLDVAAMRQRYDGLHRHGVENRSGDLLPAHILGQQVLDVRFGENAAPRGNRMNADGPLRQTVESGGRRVEQERHLVDKGPRTAGAIAVHAHVRISPFRKTTLASSPPISMRVVAYGW